MLSNVVYKFTCGQCTATYYGETTRHLKTRIAEHRDLSARTGKPVTRPLHSSIRNHALDTGHDINSDNFKVVFNSNAGDLRLAESIIIHKNRPNLNNMDSSVPLNILR